MDVRPPAPRARTLAAAVAALLLAAGLAGCGSDAPPQVRVHVGSEQLGLEPTQYCSGGDLHRYDVRPPIIQAAPGTPVIFTVPDAVAAQGWGVQVFDKTLKKRLGTVDVAQGQAVLGRITTSDVVPAAFYLVVVEKHSTQCDNLSGAWPVGIIRATGVPTFSTTSSAPTQG